MDLPTLITLAVVFFLLWYPEYEAERKRRFEERMEQQKFRWKMIVDHGIDVDDPYYDDSVEELLHWIRYGRGKPY